MTSTPETPDTDACADSSPNTTVDGDLTPVLVVADDGTICHANQAAAALLGYTADALIDRNVASLVLDGGAELELINHSENWTYRVMPRAANVPVILRVHREAYHTRDGVRSELAWMRALQADAGVKTPQAIPGLDGEDIQFVAPPGLGIARNCVLFRFIDGVEPPPDRLIPAFRQLGEVTGMTVLTDPVTHRSDRYGWAGWVHWETSGAHFYAWEQPLIFFSVDIYTCKPFDAAHVVEFTGAFFSATELTSSSW